MKKKLVIIIAAIAVLVIAACVLVLTGVIRFPHKQQEEAPSQPVAYLEYMNSYMLIDRNMKVTGSEQEVPAGLPHPTALRLPYVSASAKMTAQ